MSEQSQVIHGPNWQTVPPEPERIPVPEHPTPKSQPWVERVKSTERTGPRKRIDWANSVLKYIRELAKTLGWANPRLTNEVVGSMRLMARNYPPVEKVLTVWDALPEQDRARVFSLDRACDTADVDRDEFAGLVLAAVEKHVVRQGTGIIDRNWTRIIQAAVDHAVTGGPAGARERVELIRILDRMMEREQRAKRQERMMKRATAEPKPEPQQPVTSGQAKSLDSQMAQLDDIENIGIN